MTTRRNAWMRNKYKVSPPEKRRALGRTFGSQAEKRYAVMLEACVECEAIFDYICQPKVWLGVPVNIYVPDFLVVPSGATPYYVDVKGMESAKFMRDKKLWKQYGRLTLHIVKEKRPSVFETVELIGGGYDADR